MTIDHRFIDPHGTPTGVAARSRHRRRGSRIAAGAVVAALALGMAACGSDDGADDPSPTAPADDLDDARNRAQALLGTSEDDLPDDVRIARRGEEDFALTMDLIPGRLTVELDDDGTGGRFVVTSVQLETMDGTENFGD